MGKSKIDWCDSVWNVVTGCTPAGPGCKNCYAAKMAKRLKAMGQEKYKNGFEVTCHPGELERPHSWKKPQRVFTCSMGDLFHEQVSYEFVERVMWNMMETPRHTYLILTKRPERMSVAYTAFCQTFNGGYPTKPIANIITGTSIENQAAADERIPHLLKVPGKHFVSVEPQLELVDIAQYLDGIDWVICGCESGPNRRPFNIEWARDLKNQCVEAGVSFFFKQTQVDNKVVKMPTLDGQVWAQFPEVASG